VHLLIAALSTALRRRQESTWDQPKNWDDARGEQRKLQWEHTKAEKKKRRQEQKRKAEQDAKAAAAADADADDAAVVSAAAPTT
jgi:hypothetical protein